MNKWHRHRLPAFRAVWVIGFVLVVGLGLTGCKKAPGGTDQETGAASGQTTETVAVAPEAVGEVAASYEAVLNQYRDQVPLRTGSEPGSEAVQEDLLAQMKTLFEKKADSKAIYELYLDGIVQLSPDRADTFAAYAISGMRANSFEDYVILEQAAAKDPAGPMALTEKFFQAASKVGGKHVKVNGIIDQIEDPVLKKLVQEAQAQGYYIASSEGMLYYLVDFTAFAQHMPLHTKAFGDLLMSEMIDTLDPMMSDAAFIVEGDNIAARAYQIEKSMEGFSGKRYETYLALRYKELMSMVFYGSNNTPAFDYETNRISEEKVDLFKRIQSMEGTFMSALITEYMALIEANGGKMDDATRAKSDLILEKITAKYGLTDQMSVEFGEWMSGQKVPE